MLDVIERQKFSVLSKYWSSLTEYEWITLNFNSVKLVMTNE